MQIFTTILVSLSFITGFFLSKAIYDISDKQRIQALIQEQKVSDIADEYASWSKNKTDLFVAKPKSDCVFNVHDYELLKTAIDRANAPIAKSSR